MREKNLLWADIIKIIEEEEVEFIRLQFTYLYKY